MFSGQWGDSLPIFSVYDSHFLKNQSKKAIMTALPLGLCDNTQMIPFVTTGTELYRRPLFFFPGKIIFTVFRKQFQGAKQPCRNSGVFSLQETV